MHRVAREARPGVRGDRDEELRRAVLGDAIRRGRDVAPAAIALALHADGIGAERQVELERERLVRRTERREGDGRVLEDAVLAVAEHPAQRVAAGGRPQRAERAVTDDGLGVHRLARAVDTALGEHGGRFGAARVAPRALDVELPRREVGIPAIHRHDGAIGAEGGGDVAVESTAAPLALVAFGFCGDGRGGIALQAAQAREPSRVGGRRGARLPFGVVQRDARAGARLAVAHSRHPHGGLAHADFGVDREVGDLHHRQRLPAITRGVDLRAGDTDQLQRPGSRPRGVCRREAHAGDARDVGAVDHAEPPHGRGAPEIGPEVLPRARRRERPRLERLGDGHHGDDK